MILLFSIVIAFLPSFIWLALFLREDVHPEPNRMIIRTFVAGMLSTIPTIAVEAALNCVFRGCVFPGAAPGTTPPFASPFLALPETIRDFLYLFFGIAIVEETMKFLAVRMSALKSREFDEPIDGLLYLIIAALGFAAVENAFTVTSQDVQAAGFFGSGGILVILGARSLSATLLHTLASGIVGYFLAKSFFSKRPRHLLVTAGILVAALVHAAYNGFVSGLVQSGDAASPVGNVILLFVITGVALLAMLRRLRSVSERHRWQNEGVSAQQVDLLPR